MLAEARKVVWVTGASSGLGRSIALQLANSGALVIASARNLQALQELAAENDNIRPLACDITDAAGFAALGERIAAISPYIDQAILNAGNCEYLDFPNPDWSAVKRVMEVNFFGSVNCVEFVLPLLRASGMERPHLVVVASQVTAAPFPRAEAYGASKAALQYFCDSLRIDLAPQKIDVSVVNPGFVDTPLTRRNDFEMPFLMDVDVAAGRIIAKLESRPRCYSFPKRLSLLLGLSRLAPALWQRAVATRDKTNNDQRPES
jgi:NAD(P)-dependent dehydrogenase (short-subunit alcohol dehydrogenase family)